MVDLETAERLAFSDAVAFVIEREVIKVTGSDAASYLHGQLSQDVEGLTIGQSSWTLLLQPQGKVDAWMRLYRRSGEEFWLDVDGGFGAQAVERLARFKLRSKLETTLESGSLLAVRGPKARAVAAEIVHGVAGEVATLEAGWAGLEGVDLCLLGSGTDASASLAALVDSHDGVSMAPTELAELLRIRSGLPAMGTELDSSTIPAAARIVDQSVDFTKGCYVGQELVARVDSRGSNTPTKLYGITVDAASEEIQAGAELSSDGTVVGTVTSVAQSPELGTIGLSYLKRAVEVPSNLSLTTANGEQLVVAAVELPMKPRG